MAKANRPQQRPAQPSTSKPQPVPTRTPASASRTARNTPSVFGTRNDELVFGRENYKWMLIGIAIMAVGYVLMSGGSMPSPDVWDESIIYSPVRIILAPFIILVGLVVEIYAIFKRNTTTNNTTQEEENKA